MRGAEGACDTCENGFALTAPSAFGFISLIRIRIHRTTDTSGPGRGALSEDDHAAAAEVHEPRVNKIPDNSRRRPKAVPLDAAKHCRDVNAWQRRISYAVQFYYRW